MPLKTYEPIKVADPDTPEWRAARMTGIGASESADGLDLSDYGGPYKLYHKKVGNLLDSEDTDDTWLGRALETPIVKFWEHKNERKVMAHPCPMYRHPDYPFILATPDAIISPTDGLEIKHMNWRLAAEMGEEGTDFIPDQYVIQAQQQMLVMGWGSVEFAILVEKKLHQYKVARNEELIAVIIAGLSELWDRIQNLDEPEPDWENKSVPETVRRLFGRIEPNSVIDLSASASEAWSLYEELGREERAIQKKRAALKARVLKEIGNNSAGILPGGERMVRRKEIAGSTYTVERKSYIDARAVITKGKLK